MNNNFDEIYEKVCKISEEEINKRRKNRNISFIISMILVCCILFLDDIFISGRVISIVTVLALAISCIKFKYDNKKYKSVFKEIVIKNMVNIYNKKLIFSPLEGISVLEYKKACFYEKYNSFSSEDLIVGEIKDNLYLKMGQVKIFNKEYDTNLKGRRVVKETLLYEGLYGFVDLSNKVNNCEMEIINNQAINRFNKNRIEIDSAEFERNFDIFSTNKVRTMEIFTSDVIDEINNTVKEMGYRIHIKIAGGILYFRFPCGDCFEAPNYKKSLDYNTLHKYFKFIEKPIDIITKILENIN